jgi:antirestriction protein ArdC
MGSSEFQMKAYDLKNILSMFLDEVTTINKDQVRDIYVSEEWSNIPHVVEHLDFIIEQVTGLRDSLYDKETENEVEKDPGR